MTRSLIRVQQTESLPTVAESLSGKVPTFVVHRSFHQASQLPDLVVRAQRACGTNAAVAVATRLPLQSPEGARAFLDSVPTAALRIADPEIYTLPGPARAPHPKTLKQAAKYRYGGVPVPAAPEAKWIRDVLDAQYDAGANVMLSASGWVGTAQSQEQLAVALSFVTATRAELGADDPMFVNLTVDAPWLLNTGLRGRLLQEIVESPEPLWWLRVMWPALRPNAYSQLVDVGLLHGYKELAQTAAAEGKVVFLPNSGVTGWVATALGASGFSTGMSGPERAYLNQPPQAGGAQGNPRERFFEQNLLHTILRVDQPTLARQNGYQACTCAYCRILASGPWRKDQEQLHYLHNVAELTALLGRSSRQAAARVRVEEAVMFNSRLTGAGRLTGESAPKHLPSWATLLR